MLYPMIQNKNSKAKVITVSLIGADGAGKSTIARKLEDSFQLPIKYIYMGNSISSSNVTLPTSRLVRFLWFKLRKTSLRSENIDTAIHNKKKHKWGKQLKSTARVIMIISEEYFRQLISWFYQLRGYNVIYDRHFTSEFNSDIIDYRGRSEPIANRLHCWLLAHFYPRPDLIVLLEAPPEVLMDRKGEGTLSYLEARQQAFIKQGENIQHFIKVDATQSIEDVFNEVSRHILQFYKKRTGRKAIAGVTK